MLLNKSDSDVKSLIISLIKENKIILVKETISAEGMSEDHKDLRHNFQNTEKSREHE